MKPSKILWAMGAVTLFVACSAGLAACSSSSSTSGGVAATVNGTEVAENDVTNYIENFRSAQSLTNADDWGAWMAQYSLTPDSVRSEVIDYYVGIDLVKQAAAENDITVSDDDVNDQVSQMKAKYSSDDAWNTALQQAGTTEDQYRESVRTAMLESALQEKVASDSSEPSDSDVLTYVQQYASYFSGAKRSSQILFSSDDQATAQSVLDQINAGTLSFEDAAKQYSTDTASASSGGDVGWDLLNSFVTEYTDALKSLDKGQVSGLVTSQYGIHIIKCTDVFTAPDQVTSLDQVPSALVDYVRSMVKSTNQNSSYSSWYSDYKSKADIVTNDMPSGLPYDLDMSKYQTSDSSDSSSSSDDSSSDSSSSSTGSSSSSMDTSATATGTGSSTTGSSDSGSSTGTSSAS
jgi:foldase protein PrsA